MQSIDHQYLKNLLTSHHWNNLVIRRTKGMSLLPCKRSPLDSQVEFSYPMNFSERFKKGTPFSYAPIYFFSSISTHFSITASPFTINPNETENSYSDNQNQKIENSAKPITNNSLFPVYALFLNLICRIGPAADTVLLSQRN